MVRKKRPNQSQKKANSQSEKPNTQKINDDPSERLASQASEPSTSTSSTVQRNSFSDASKFSAQNYTVRSGTVNFGKEYEYKIAALLSLRCIRRNIEDVWLASNAEGTGAFDDVILRLKATNGSKVTYMIQLKHQAVPENIKQKEFVNAKGDFALTKYFKDIVILQNSVDSKKEEPRIIPDLGDFNDIYFILFTNRGIGDLELFEESSNSHLSLINSNAYASPYKFNFSKLSEHLAISEVVSNSNFYLLVRQPGVNDIDKRIVEEITRLFNNLPLSKVNMKEVVENYSTYITNWAKGSLGGYYYLTRNEILYKLTEFILYPYAMKLRDKPFTSEYDDNKQLVWKEIVVRQIITVVKETETTTEGEMNKILHSLIQFISAEVQKYCEHKIEYWGAELSEKQQKLLLRTQNCLKEHIMRSVGEHGKINPMDIYKSVWKIQKLPLFLEIDDPDQYIIIERALKLSNYSYKILILYKNAILPLEEQGDVRRFETLDDLNEEEQDKVLVQTVKLQGRSGAKLKDFVTREMFPHINTYDVLSILSDNFNIGDSFRPVPEYFLERTISKTVIKPEILLNRDNEIFLVDGKRDSQCCKLEEVDLRNPDNIPGVINIQGGLTSLQLDNIKACKKPIHILSTYDDRHFYLKWTSEFTSTIKNYKTEVEFSLYQGVIENFLQTTAIIDAVPGMGKTVLVDYVATLAPANMWVLRIDLNTYMSFFRKHNDKTSAAGVEDHLRYFYKSTVKDADREPLLSRQVFESLLKSKDILILLDGFDEVVNDFKDQMANIAMLLHETGYKVCITTRPSMKQRLEEALKTTSDTIKPFTMEDQEHFLTNYFNTTHMKLTIPTKSNTIMKFVKQLLDATCENLNDRDAQFTGIPLQTQLLADAFSDECKNSILKEELISFNHKFDLLYLYDRFFQNKINIFLEKYGQHAGSFCEEIIKDQFVLALVLIFPSKSFKHLRVIYQFETIHEKYRDKNKRQKLEQLGILFIDYNDNILCVHRTIAEYLTAKWLVQNSSSAERQTNKLVCSLIRTRFSDDHNFLFNIYDQMATKDCPVHQAILKNNIKDALNVIGTSGGSLRKTDTAGRTALHVAALSSRQYPLPYEESNLKDEEDPISVIVETLLDSSLDSNIANIKDLAGYTALDYAFSKCSLGTANRICNKMDSPLVNAHIDLNFRLDYLSYCKNYPSLFILLVPYFASRDLLLNRINKNCIIKNYAGKTPNNPRIESFINSYGDLHAIKFLQSDLGRMYMDHRKSRFSICYSDLRFAIAFGSDNNVKRLLPKGEDSNEQDIEGNAPLHYAAIHGKSEIIKLLLTSGADINIQNNEWNTPLHIAASTFDYKILKALLARESNVNIGNKKGNTTMHFLAKYKNTGNISIFAFNNIRTTIKALTTAGGKINCHNNFGDTPLHIAAKGGCKDIVKLIINEGGCVNLRNTKEDTPLHFALNERFKDIANLIISEGGDINAQNLFGDTPLTLALTANYTDLAATTISKGGDVKAADNCDNTPLHIAASNGYDELAHLIMSKGVDINAENWNCETPLHMALGRGHKELATLIIFKGGDVNTMDTNGDAPLHTALNQNFKDLAELIINQDGDVNAQDISGNTSLHIASSKGYKELAELIISKGGDVTVRNRTRDTPLHIACREGYKELVELIVSNGGDTSARNLRNETPRQIALNRGDKELADLVSKDI